MATKPKTSSRKGVVKRARPRAVQRKQTQQPTSAASAKAALGIPATTIDAGGFPLDAAGTATTTSPDMIKVGNRRFSAEPRTLAKRKLDILPDLPDVRDRIYQPSLRWLRASIYPQIAFPVRDQGTESSCTGFALAHVIDCLIHREVLEGSPLRVSARMLYEMAKRNDEWSGTAYEGSSVRGGINGFYRNGVCSEALAPNDATGEWVLTYEMNKNARETRLGAYYRLQPDISDYHAALNETGVIYASAQIHKNWETPTEGKIEPGGAAAGGHAFAIVGYDADGFWVLNSWGESWGIGGIAHWRYEDWAATMMDAWVLQLGVRAPTAFSAVPRATPGAASVPRVAATPNRSDIVGHFINIDDGRYVTGDRYGSPSEPEMAETVQRLTSDESNSGQGYDHLLIYAHGGLNTEDDEANRIATWQRNNIFGRNKIYNFHLMWGSGLLDEAFGQLSETQAGRAAGVIGDLLFEVVAKPLGSRAWRNMKQDAAAAFTQSAEYDGGYIGLAPLLKGIDKAARRPVVHLVGHSAGAIVLGRLLGAFARFGLQNVQLGSIHLMAPACTVEFFNAMYGPYLKGQGASKLKDKIYLYCMSDKLEQADTVGVPGLPTYGRSLLYLVSRAYEDTPNIPIAGMQAFAGALSPANSKLSIDYAQSAATGSTSHGGFDNDVATLTTIMSRILGKKVAKPPTSDELTGY